MQITRVDNEVKFPSSIIEELVLESKKQLDYFFMHLDMDAVMALVDELESFQGVVFSSGIGKSGIIAKKVANTLSSCGTKSIYLSPINALHGDIGLVSEGDYVFLISKSGETDELLHLCPALRNKGARLIAVVSTPKSRLAAACDRAILLPVSRELCPFDLAPTTSTAAQLLFGDLLAIALMRKKSFSKDDFVNNHPAGRIGRRSTIKVKDLMIRGSALPLCRKDEKIVDILVELSNKRSGCIMVADENMNLLGIFTDGDLRRALQSHAAEALDLPIEKLMIRKPRTTTLDTLAWDAMKEMESNQKGAITSMPVVEGGKLMGLIRLHDIVQSGL